jgi:peptide/nickel transport system substrate-binding protein
MRVRASRGQAPAAGGPGGEPVRGEGTGWASRLPRGLATLALALAAGCAEGRSEWTAAGGPGAGQPDAPPRYGGTAVVALDRFFDALTPLSGTATEKLWMNHHMLFMPVLLRDAELEQGPYLARAWELSPDSTSLTLHLRDDVRWHDGTRVTARDVQFTYELARAAAIALPGVYDAYGAMEVVDSVTLRVATTPHADMLEAWGALVPVPHHLLGDVPADELPRHRFNVEPVGNGPFRFVSRTPGQQVVLAANEDFPAELGGRPYLDRIVLRYVPDGTARLTELLIGAAHLAPVEPLLRHRVEEGGRARLLPYRVGGYSYVAWNTLHPLFADVRVRRALTLAIDRRGIVDGLLHGYADGGGPSSTRSSGTTTPGPGPTSPTIRAPRAGCWRRRAGPTATATASSRTGRDGSSASR